MTFMRDDFCSRCEVLPDTIIHILSVLRYTESVGLQERGFITTQGFSRSIIFLTNGVHLSNEVSTCQGPLATGMKSSRVIKLNACKLVHMRSCAWVQSS